MGGRSHSSARRRDCVKQVLFCCINSAVSESWSLVFTEPSRCPTKRNLLKDSIHRDSVEGDHAVVHVG
jgi:hypothetical protein